MGEGLATNVDILDFQLNAETLEIDNDCKHEHSGQQVVDVGKICAVESLAQCTHLIE